MAELRQANYTDYTSDYNELQFVIRQRLSDIQTALPVEVVKVKADKKFVDIKPLVQQISADGSVIDHGIIHNVPYFRLQGGNNGIIIDPAIGDIGICVFCSRDISGVKNALTTSPPSSRRMHNFSDGLYIGGILNISPSNIIDFNDSGIDVYPNGLFKYNGIEVATKNDVNASNKRALMAEEAINSDLNKETKRASDAEFVLQENLKIEISRATTEEIYLQSEIDAEISRATTAEAAETAARIAADNVLTANLNAEITRAESAENTLTLNLAAETTRATTAENTLALNLATETTRATAAENTLTLNLAAETTRATSAENTLTLNLAAETTRAENVENTLTLNLATETTRATAAENTLTLNLAAETTRATNAENTLTLNLAAETTRAENIENTLTLNLSDETTNRTTADTDLQTQITALSNKMIGVGQTWQDVSSSRQTHTSYTNNTSKPIFVEVSDKNVVNNGLEMVCDGVTVGYFSFDAGNTNASIGAIIPKDSVYMVYKLNSGGDRMTTVENMQWSELR